MDERETSRRVVIDRRPLWRIVAERVARPGGATALVLLTFALARLPPPEGLSEGGFRALLVLAVSLVLWVGDLLPLAATGLLAVVLLPLLEVLPRGRVFAFFWNEAVFFILGEFILAVAAIQTGLATRMGLGLLARFDRTPASLISGVLLSSGLLALVMPTNAITAMFFPVALEITRQLSLRPGRSRYAKALFLALAWGPSWGGIATFLGSPRNPLAVGILHQLTGQNISLGLWFLAVAPVACVAGLACWVLLRLFFPSDLAEGGLLREVLAAERRKLGMISYREMLCALVFTATIVAWIVRGELVGMGVIALAAAVLVLLLGVVRWSDVERYVNWGILLMTGGAVALGSALAETGAGRWLAERTIGWAGAGFGALLLLAVVAKLLSEVVSSAPAITILTTLAVGIAPRYDLDVRVAVLVAAVPTGLAFLLPMSAPRTAIAFSSGYLRVGDVVVPGLIVSLLSLIGLALAAWLYWPLLDLG